MKTRPRLPSVQKRNLPAWLRSVVPRYQARLGAGSPNTSSCTYAFSSSLARNWRGGEVTSISAESQPDGLNQTKTIKCVDTATNISVSFLVLTVWQKLGSAGDAAWLESDLVPAQGGNARCKIWLGSVQGIKPAF